MSADRGSYASIRQNLDQPGEKPANVKGEIIFVVGGPGSGKSTHCKLLAEDLGYVHISTGELIKDVLDENPASPDEDPEVTRIREMVKYNELLDDQMIMDLIKSKMREYPRALGFLIDGCPRNNSQLELFEKQIKPCTKVVYLETDEQQMRERLLARPKPETRGAVDTKVRIYHSLTMPVIRRMQHEKANIFHTINTSRPEQEVYSQLKENLQSRRIEQVGYWEFMRMYLSCGNFYDAVDELQNRHGGANDFLVMIGWTTWFYIIQNREDVRTILSARTHNGYQNHNFEVAAGHTLNINALQMDDPLWKEIHSCMSGCTGDKALVTGLIQKHIPKLLAREQFALDTAFEKFMLDFWCEYMFGSKVNPDEYRATRTRMLEALTYAFYSNKWKSTPYVGNATCRLYGYRKSAEFQAVDRELQRYIHQCDDGFMARLRQKLLASETFPKDKVEQALLDNLFDLVLVFDFPHNALYEALAEIVRRNIDSTARRKLTYNQGLANSYLFPFRVRVPQEDLRLKNTTVPAGKPIYINLLKSGFFNSSGPRACIGTLVTEWMKEALWSYLDGKHLQVVGISFPEERARLSHNRDVPVSPERYEVRWSPISNNIPTREYARDYLQKILPDYPFKGVEHFYDVLKLYENHKLRSFIANDFVRAIKQQGIDLSKLVIATPEVRGIGIAAIVAHILEVPLVHIRKPDKIPGPVKAKEYSNAYTVTEKLEISTTSDIKGREVVFIDDGIASGGTTLASCALIEELGGKVSLVQAIIDHKYKEKPAELTKYKVHTTFDFQANAAKPANDRLVEREPAHEPVAVQPAAVAAPSGMRP